MINRLQVEFTTLAAKNDLLIYQLRTFNVKVTEIEKNVFKTHKIPLEIDFLFIITI